MSDEQTGNGLFSNVLAGLARRADSIINELSGIGDPTVDKGSSGRWRRTRHVRPALAEAIYLGNPYGEAAVELLPRDALRHGWHLDVTDAEIDTQALEDLEGRLGFRRAFRQAAFWGRAQGAAWLWVVVADGKPLSEPLDPSSNYTIEAVHLLQREEVSPRSWNANPASPRYREVEQYTIAPNTQAGGGTHTIHHTRLIEFWGRWLPLSARLDNDGYHGSVLTTTEAAIRRMTEADMSLPQLLAEYKISAVRISTKGVKKGVSDLVAYLAARYQQLNRYKSTTSTIILDEGEEYAQSQLNVSGVDRIIDKGRESLAAAVGTPMVKMFGIAPAGMTSDDKASARNWAMRQADLQEQIEDALRRWYELVLGASNGPTGGVMPSRWSVVLGSVDEPTDEERAQLAASQAQTDAAYISMGLPPEVVLLHRFGSGQYNPAPLTLDEETEAALIAALAVRLRAGEEEE